MFMEHPLCARHWDAAVSEQDLALVMKRGQCASRHTHAGRQSLRFCEARVPLTGSEAGPEPAPGTEGRFLEKEGSS